MDYITRYQQLAKELTGVPALLSGDSGIAVRYFPFYSQTLIAGAAESSRLVSNDRVPENQQFQYPVFYSTRKTRQQEVIVLLHGLNERSWTKYYTWAEYLCSTTGKAVILFPIAYHVNRSPVDWSNPRVLQQLLAQRKERTGNDRSLSFANLALSERLSEQPLRFFTSGRQSYFDLISLCTAIINGRHSFFAPETRVDVFAYSIGAFLAQILFLSNPSGLFSNSRLFMFCGGGIFSSMCGSSRSIMDTASYNRLYRYYMDEFNLDEAENSTGSEPARTFFSMIAPFNLKEKRLQLFQGLKDRLKGISLSNDKVIPYQGVQLAMGTALAGQTVSLLDFPYAYTHENPFPVSLPESKEVDRAFFKVFKIASEFLA